MESTWTCLLIEYYPILIMFAQPVFSNLSLLYSVDENKITGTIPSELGQLTSLLDLDLGKLIVQWNYSVWGWCLLIECSLHFFLMAHISFFAVDGNGMNGTIPPQLGQLTSLTELYLGKKIVQWNYIVWGCYCSLNSIPFCSLHFFLWLTFPLLL